MTLDIRATVWSNLGGEVISGSVSDDFAQENGLIKTQGELTISGIVNPRPGSLVKLAYSKNGKIIAFPRALRVLSYTNDPFQKTTTVQLGCTLTYLSDISPIPVTKETGGPDNEENPAPPPDPNGDPPVFPNPIKEQQVTRLYANQIACEKDNPPDPEDPEYDPEDPNANDPPATGYDSAQDINDKKIPPVITARDIYFTAIRNLGLSTVNSPLLQNKFQIEEFEYTAGYVSVLNDLLQSECFLGYMDANDKFRVIDLAFGSSTGSSPVLTENDIIALDIVGSGVMPADVVIGRYSSKKIEYVPKPIPPEDPENPPPEPEPAPPEPEYPPEGQPDFKTEPQSDDEEKIHGLTGGWEYEELNGGIKEISIVYEDKLDNNETKVANYGYEEYTQTQTKYGDSPPYRQVNPFNSCEIVYEETSADLTSSVVYRQTYENGCVAMFNQQYVQESLEYGNQTGSGLGSKTYQKWQFEWTRYDKEGNAVYKVTESYEPLIAFFARFPFKYRYVNPFTSYRFESRGALTITYTTVTYGTSWFDPTLYTGAGFEGPTLNSYILYERREEYIEHAVQGLSGYTGEVNSKEKYQTDTATKVTTMTYKPLVLTQRGQQAVSFIEKKKLVNSPDDFYAIASKYSELVLDDTEVSIKSNRDYAERRTLDQIVIPNEESEVDYLIPKSPKQNSKSLINSYLPNPRTGKEYDEVNYETTHTSIIYGAGAEGMAARVVELAPPMVSDEIIKKNGSVATGYTYSIEPSNAGTMVNRYGRVQNQFRLGNRSGLSLQLAPESIPSAPLSKIAISIDGKVGQYRTNGNSWTFDSNGIIASTDAIFWGGIGVIV